MDVKLDIFAGAISDAINNTIRYIHIDADEIVNSVALIVLEEIAQVIRNTEIIDDFYVVEKIVCIFEKYNIKIGVSHDF